MKRKPWNIPASARALTAASLVTLAILSMACGGAMFEPPCQGASEEVSASWSDWGFTEEDGLVCSSGEIDVMFETKGDHYTARLARAKLVLIENGYLEAEVHEDSNEYYFARWRAQDGVDLDVSVSAPGGSCCTSVRFARRPYG